MIAVCCSPSTYTKKKALEENAKIEELKIVRALVSVLNHSTQMLDKLKEIQVQRNYDDNPFKIMSDVVTRW
jgi:hypothetical protein